MVATLKKVLNLKFTKIVQKKKMIIWTPLSNYKRIDCSDTTK